jgi:hypothetical protein
MKRTFKEAHKGFDITEREYTVTNDDGCSTWEVDVIDYEIASDGISLGTENSLEEARRKIDSYKLLGRLDKHWWRYVPR